MNAIAGSARGSGSVSDLMGERIHAIGLTRSLDRVTGRCLSSAYVIANRAPRHEADPAFRAKRAPCPREDPSRIMNARLLVARLPNSFAVRIN
jgi:hypothetical protein